MPINVEEPLSPGWWMLRLARQLEAKQLRLLQLNNWFEGNPPLPIGAESMREAVQRFQRLSRTNFAELVVLASRRRMKITGIATAAVADDRGDDIAWGIHSGNAMSIKSADLHESMGTFGEGYVMVSTVDDELAVPVITEEDPRQIITEHDPLVDRRVLAGYKTYHDDVHGLDVAFLYLPAEEPGAGCQVFKATRESKRGTTVFSPRMWNWVIPEIVLVDDDDTLIPSRLKGVDRVPIVRFLNNRRGTGDFETHIDLLDRINHEILQRLIIATFQAFRQRAVKGDLPETDPKGKTIDYDEVLTADPGAFWLLPAAVEMWESGQVDLTPILASIKDDLQELSAVTSVPLHVFSPDAATQSAEGASLLKEQEIFKVEDKNDRAGEGWRDVYSLGFQFLGDADRADRSKIVIHWAPVDRPSLNEKASAAAQSAPFLPERNILTDIYGYPVERVDEMMAERAAEGLTAAPVDPGVGADAA